MFRTVHSSINTKEIIDVHVHIGGPPAENDAMYYWSEKFTKSLSFEGIKLVTRLSAANVTGARYMSVVFSQLKQSKYVDKAVLLALDQVYSEDGKAQKKATHLYVSNEYLAHLSQIYPGFLFGCSVHPYAPDALERLWISAKNGAVLCKWLPSSQSIDPTHPLAERFYRALAELELPLLIHVGPEETIPSALSPEDELLVNAAAGQYSKEPGDAILMALEAGAKVIIAHCGVPLGPLLNPNNPYWEDVFEKLLMRLYHDHSHASLYADLSAFCLPGRFKYVKRIIPLAGENPSHFLYGSDYPIPSISLKEGRTLEEILKAFGWLAGRALPGNDFDKNFNLLKPHFPEETFIAAAHVLRHPQKPLSDLNRYLRRVDRKRKRIFWFQRMFRKISKR